MVKRQSIYRWICDLKNYDNHIHYCYSFENGGIKVYSPSLKITAYVSKNGDITLDNGEIINKKIIDTKDWMYTSSSKLYGAGYLRFNKNIKSSNTSRIEENRYSQEVISKIVEYVENNTKRGFIDRMTSPSYRMCGGYFISNGLVEGDAHFYTKNDTQIDLYPIRDLFDLNKNRSYYGLPVYPYIDTIRSGIYVGVSDIEFLHDVENRDVDIALKNLFHILDELNIEYKWAPVNINRPISE